MTLKYGVVTRLFEEDSALFQKIRAMQLAPVLFPTVNIIDIPLPEPLQRYLTDLTPYEILIFISPTAVTKATRFIKTVPPHIRIFAPGPGTAKAVSKQGWGEAVYPSENFSAEALLLMPELLKSKDKTMLICQGDGGNVRLSGVLRARGANVTQVILYRRALAIIEKKLPGTNDIAFIICTSGESLRNLVTLAGADVLDSQLLLSSERLKTLAMQLGFRLSPIVAKNASEDALIHALQQYC